MAVLCSLKILTHLKSGQLHMHTHIHTHAHTHTRPHTYTQHQVIVPEIEPHDPSTGILHDHTTRPRLLPYTHANFIQRRVQLVSPVATQQLQADCMYQFQVVVPGQSALMLLY